AEDERGSRTTPAPALTGPPSDARSCGRRDTSVAAETGSARTRCSAARPGDPARTPPRTGRSCRRVVAPDARRRPAAGLRRSSPVGTEDQRAGGHPAAAAHQAVLEAGDLRGGDAAHLTHPLG